MAHNNGLPDNIHFYEVVEGIQDNKICKQVRTGPSIAKNVGELNKRSKKYFDDHKSVRLFPPTYYLKEDVTKQFVDKVDGLGWLANKPIKILTNYNPVDHLKLLGLSEKERNKIMSRTYKEYDNVVLVIHPEEKWLMVNVVVDGADPKTLQLEMEKMNDILKTIYKTGYQKLKEHYITLIGLIICPHIEEKDLNSKVFPFLNDNKPMFPFVTKKEWNNLGLLEDKFKSLVNESKRNIRKCQSQSGAIKKSSTDDIEMYTGQIMASMAQRSLFLPKVTDNLEEKIDTILLNDDQINTINHTCKWKIINGGFGSGKTVVLNEIARNAIKQDNIGAICYLPFAPYSLIDKKFEESFHLLCNDQKIDHLSFKLKSISLQECIKEMDVALSDVYDLTSPPVKNVALIMEHLKTKYCIGGKSMAILIDEFPREFIDKDYASRLTESLEKHFKDIIVAISFQSVQKIREFETYGEITNPRQCSIEIPGMKEFKLGKTMRMELNNYQLNIILQEEISQSKHITPLRYERSKTPLAYLKRIKSVIFDKKTSAENPKQKSKDTFDDMERNRERNRASDKSDEPRNPDEPNPEFTNPIRSSKNQSDTSCFHDPEFISKNMPRKPEDKLVSSISTKISFIESKCGIQFCSSTKPRLHLFSSSLTSYKSIVCLSLVLKKCIKDAEKVVIICTSKEQVETMKMALDKIDLDEPYNVYTPYLSGPLPESQLKSKIIKASNSTNFILVTDYRSFRGCEAEKCIMFIDLDEQIGPNIFVEILTRAVAYLDILVIPRNQKSAPSVMDKVLNKWRRAKWRGENLVSEVCVDSKFNRIRNSNQIDVTISESGERTETFSEEVKHEEEEAFKILMELSDVDDVAVQYVLSLFLL